MCEEKNLPEKIVSCLKQIRINFKYTSKKSFVWTSSIIATFQIIGFLCDFDSIFPEYWTFLTRLIISTVIVTILFCIVFIFWNIKVLNKECVTVIRANNGHYVYVEYGDILAKSNEQRNVVITANRCFDTIVDNNLISETTIHGKIIKQICNDSYTPKMLEEALQNDILNNRQVQLFETLEENDKRIGSRNRYPAGTIAEFKKDNITYFFIGMSAFNRELHPETTDKEYSITIQALIEHCNLRAQGFPVYIPIIGAYGRNHQKSERELLEYIVSCFRFHRHLINTDIHIVVYSGHRDEVSIYGLDS